MTSQSDPWRRLADRASLAYRSAPTLPADLTAQVLTIASTVLRDPSHDDRGWMWCGLAAAMLAIVTAATYGFLSYDTQAGSELIVTREFLP